MIEQLKNLAPIFSMAHLFDLLHINRHIHIVQALLVTCSHNSSFIDLIVCLNFENAYTSVFFAIFVGMLMLYLLGSTFFHVSMGY